MSPRFQVVSALGLETPRIALKGERGHVRIGPPATRSAALRGEVASCHGNGPSPAPWIS